MEKEVEKVEPQKKKTKRKVSKRVSKESELREKAKKKAPEKAPVVDGEFKVIRNLRHDGKKFKPGSMVSGLNEKQIKQLKQAGVIE